MTKDQKAEVIGTYTGRIIKSPLKAIRQYCLTCCMESPYEVKECTAHNCLLYPFRFGNNPHSTRELTPDQKSAAVARLAAARDKIGGGDD